MGNELLALRPNSTFLLRLWLKHIFTRLTSKLPGSSSNYGRRSAWHRNWYVMTLRVGWMRASLMKRSSLHISPRRTLLDWFHAVHCFIFTHRSEYHLQSCSIAFFFVIFLSASPRPAAYKDEKSKKIFIGLITATRVPRSHTSIVGVCGGEGEASGEWELSNSAMIGLSSSQSNAKWLMRKWLRWILVPRFSLSRALLVYENFSFRLRVCCPAGYNLWELLQTSNKLLNLWSPARFSLENYVNFLVNQLSISAW